MLEEDPETLASLERSFRLANPPACYGSLLSPSSPKCPRVPESIPEKGGCPRECPTGVSPGPRALECPKCVPRVSGTPFDTPGTLSGDFLDTLEPETARRTLLRTRGALFREHCIGRENSLSFGSNSVSSVKHSVSVETLFDPEGPEIKKIHSRSNA